MSLFLSHFTALRYWRRSFPVDEKLGRESRVKLQTMDYRKLGDELAELPVGFKAYDGVTDLLVSDRSGNRKIDSCRVHCWSTDVPVRAFHRFNSETLVSSPEFVFVQLAASLTISELVALGMELCGSYILSPKGDLRAIVKNNGVLMITEREDDAAPRRMHPLTSVARLTKAVEETPKARGHRKAKRALRFLVDGSASPYETLTTMFLCMSPMLGGYGLPLPAMNHRVIFSSDVALMAHRTEAYCDLAWPDAHLDIEYLGRVHGTADRMEDDAARRDALAMAGYHVRTVSKSRIHSVTRFEKIAEEAAALLGRRIRKDALGITDARMSMRSEALRWTSSGGVGSGLPK